MPDTLLPIQATTIPDGLCSTGSLSTDIPVIATYLRALLSGNEINTGDTTPVAEDRDKPWLRTNSDGTDDGKWVFYGGFWIQKHPLPAGLVAMFEGALADIVTFDGGEVALISSIAGAFWEEVTQMQARSPIHPGTLASGTIINVGDNIGEEKHVMAVTEMIEHHHSILSSHDGGTGGDGAEILNAPESSLTDRGTTTENTGNATPDGMNVIQPSRGIYFIRRTARLYRRRPA